MKFTIKNLGSISQGELDISKRLTLFCGPNNTGKTYVSYIVYALLKSRFYFDIGSIPSFSDLIANGEASFSIDQEGLLRYRRDRVTSVIRNKESIFGLSEVDSKNLFANLELSYSLSDQEFISKAIEEELDYCFLWENNSIRVLKSRGSSIVSIKNEEKDIRVETDSLFFEWQLLSDLYERLINAPFINASIFPVERISVYTFNKELSIQRNELIEQMQALKDNKKLGYDSVDKLLGRSTRYPLAIRDCLSVANDLTNLQKNKSEFASFAEDLENKLINGKMVVTKNGDVQFTPKAGQRLPVQLTASVVKALSSLIFYLKHIAKKGDLVIIDEPEMNLHPDAQVLLTRIFAQLINSGVNMLISTHSDYIIRELNNLICLGSLINSAEFIRELGYHQNEIILPEDVSVYLFKPIRKNSRVSQIMPVPVGRDGFSITTIDAVINRSNDYLDRILYQMEYGQGD